MNTAIIALGSNIDPEQNIKDAQELIAKSFSITGSSAFIKTKPVGFTDQNDFLNGSIAIETNLDMAGLKKELKTLESRLHRQSSPIKFGPRTIDLDIVVFNGKVVDQDFYEREFLKNAVLQIMPDLKY